MILPAVIPPDVAKPLMITTEQIQWLDLLSPEKRKRFDRYALASQDMATNECLRECFRKKALQMLWCWIRVKKYNILQAVAVSAVAYAVPVGGEMNTRAVPVVEVHQEQRHFKRCKSVEM